MSIMMYLFLLFIAWGEFGSYFGGYLDEQYIIDPELRQTTQINMDVMVQMPCKYLDVKATDITRDINDVSKRLVFKNIPFFVPYGTTFDSVNEVRTPDIDGMLADAIPLKFRENIPDADLPEEFEFNGCHIYGSIPVNRVKGELHITPKGWRYSSRQRVPHDEINLTHIFNEFSFGEFFPYIDNTLDQVGRYAQQRLTRFHYFVSVLPTIYRKMGAVVDTNQYSVSHNDITYTSSRLYTPGIFILYNFEALTVVVQDKRISFWAFLIRLVTMLSFIVYIAAWAFRLVDWLLISTLGPRWSLRYGEPHDSSKGLLE